MKRLIAIILVCSIQLTFAETREDTKDSSCDTKALPSPDKQAEVGEVEKLTSDLEKENLHILANKICMVFETAKLDNSTNIDGRVNKFIESYLGLPHDQDNSASIIKFWNEKSADLICEVPSTDGRKREHVLKRSVALIFHREMFFQYLFSFKNPKITFNTIENVNGKDETLLDYIDKIIASKDFESNFNTEEVIKLRKILATKFDAKTSQELQGIASN